MTTWQAYPVERCEHAGSDNAIKATAEKGRVMGQVVLSSFCEGRRVARFDGVLDTIRTTEGLLRPGHSDDEKRESGRQLAESNRTSVEISSRMGIVRIQDV